MYIYILFIHLLMHIWVLATVNSAAMNMDLQISVQVPAFHSFGCAQCSFVQMGKLRLERESYLSFHDIAH